VYREGVDEGKVESDESYLPAMSVGDQIALKGIRSQQHFTEPPPRYTEASLIKTLEEYGIGRPSTYAAIISTLQERKYAELDNKRFRPTDVARVVNKFLTQHFTNYVDYHFTARLEDELDAIARGDKTWLPVMRDFWTEFKQLLDLKLETVRREDVTQEKLDEDCPKCGKPLSARLGRRGRFIGCTSYPECDYTRNLDGKEKSATPELEIVEGRECPKCASSLVVRDGPYGRFIGCSSYPKCKFLEPLDNKPTSTGVECPECKKGSLLQRRSRRGKVFFSCSEYPACSYATWNEPIAMTCPSCQWPVLTIKTTKRKGRELVCPQKECGFAEPYEQGDQDESAPPHALAS
jgi:DNA topoisomerase-1